MEAKPYNELSDLSLLALCCYREARGEPIEGKRGVCHVIKNRTLEPSWWGDNWSSVILKPHQFSSFNANDHNSGVWPQDDEPAWKECLAAAGMVYNGADEDLTQGAVFYHDTSIGWPRFWGNAEEYVNTINIGRLKFYRPLP